MDQQSHCHRIINIHPGILALPGVAFGRQKETEFFRKPLGDDTSWNSWIILGPASGTFFAITALKSSY